MNCKAMYIIMLALVIFVGCDSIKRTISVKPSTADFSNVYLGNSEDIVLIIKNNYSYKITVTNLIMEGSTDYTISDTVSTPFEIQVGEKYFLAITFEPTEGGIREGLLKIRHNGELDDKDVKLIGNGVPAARLSISEAHYDFRKKLIGVSHTHEFVIENTGTAVLELKSIKLTNTGASVYTINDNNTPIFIQPKMTHTLKIAFKPIALGNYVTDLYIAHNAVNIDDPLVIDIKGTGVLVNPQIQLSVGSTWNFNSVSTILSSTRACRIDNNGTEPLTISSATLKESVEFTIQFLRDSNGTYVSFPQVVQPSDYVTLYVNFAPLAKISYEDTLIIKHDGNNEISPLNIPLIGEGRDLISKNFGFTGLIDNWVVPNDVTMVRIEAWGAEGGGSGWSVTGKGARIRGDFDVLPGEIIKLAVGEVGHTGGQGGGGGGGSFVILNYQPLVIAGGGGGAHYNNNGLDAKDGVTTSTCTPHSSTGIGCTGGSGGGWMADGANGDYNTGGGKSWGNGLAGGPQHTGGLSHWSNGDGGFGGGGGGCWAPGSGGGYNGGVCATSGGNQTPGGTGGGSINNGKNQSNSSGVQYGHGKIIISY